MLAGPTHTLKKRPRPAAGGTAAVAAVFGGFNDPISSDVLLRLLISSDPDSSAGSADDADELCLHLHAHALLRSHYFAALLSDRWRRGGDGGGGGTITLRVTPSAVDAHLTVLRLLYAGDFSGEIATPAAAIAALPVALALLFEDLVRACVRFLEAVPWSEEEEEAVVSLAPLLPLPDSADLLARLSPAPSSSSEEMLHDLVRASVGSHKVKAFAAKMVRDFSSREVVRRVFDRAFAGSLKTVRESMERYSSPELRGDHEETEAIQRLNLHTAVSKVKDLLWLLELMIELRVADTAVEEWSAQTAFVADLQRAFQEDAWRNNAPALPALVMKCTCRIADAVAAGWVLAARQVMESISFPFSVTLLC